MKELLAIQTELKAPKDKRSNFGNYNYRSAENILEAVKPLLKQYNCQLTLTDAVEQIGDRYFVKATATLEPADEPQGKSVSVTAYACHGFDQKGMNVAQMTGSTSSYARKYALAGLFLLDGEKDPDAIPAVTASTPAMATPPMQTTGGAIPPPPPIRR